jgi:hypothetical protein
MNQDVHEPIVRALRELCLRVDGARTFFEWAASRQNDAAATSIDVFERKSGMDRASCIDLAKELSRIGCGQYIIGRRNRKTRVEWDYGLKGIALAAVGREVTLQAVDPELAAELDDQPDSSPLSSPVGARANDHLTIPEAKRRLAASLGVAIDCVDITIRA